jgi:hypothetical protein
MPQTMLAGLGWRLPPRRKIVASDAIATPKLIDICCTVLAMVLPLLSSASFQVGKRQRIHADVLNRREKNPKKNASAAITQTGVPWPMVMNRRIIAPDGHVLKSSTFR